MGNEKAYYYRCQISSNIHHEPQKQEVKVVYLLQ